MHTPEFIDHPLSINPAIQLQLWSHVLETLLGLPYSDIQPWATNPAVRPPAAQLKKLLQKFDQCWEEPSGESVVIRTTTGITIAHVYRSHFVGVLVDPRSKKEIICCLPQNPRGILCVESFEFPLDANQQAVETLKLWMLGEQGQ